MGKKLVRWQLAGFLLTGMAGALLHFAYDWSGKSPFAAAFAAVNESIWEHMKLLFVPLFLFALAESWALGDDHRNFWSAKLAGILLGLGLIPALYYTCTGALGLSLDWVNIAIYYVAAAAAFLLETRLMRRKSVGNGAGQLAALTILWLLAIAFVVLTWYPPRVPLFQDPVTGLYGLTK